MATALLETIGVEAVVEGLSAFTSDIGQINDLIEGLKLPASGIEKAFDGITSAIGSFGREILNTVETALGVMLRDAIEWTIGKLREMAEAAFDAGNEFQLMKMRLQGFNLQDLVNSGVDYTTAMTRAVEVTKEQMNWITKLAAITPFDATDVGNIFTLAKSYSFATEDAQRLTENIMDFTAAMGLSGTEAQRIIVNLGQMAQRGKITTREMNDLARGAFVPISDILDRVAAKMNITTEALTKLISKPGGGVDPELFFNAFNEMIETEVRFEGGSVRMAHTFRGAWENITQTLRDVIGGFILLPGFLDPIGNALGDIMDSVGDHWEEITAAAQGVGENIRLVVQSLLDIFMPAADDIGVGIVDALNNISDWIYTHRQDILDFFYNIGTTIRDDVIPWVRDTLIPTIGKIFDWVQTNGPTIQQFFSTLGEVIGEVFQRLTGRAFEGTEGTGIDKLLGGVTNFMNFIIDHKEELTTFVTAIARIAIAINMATLAVNSILSLLQVLIGLFVALISPVSWVAVGFGEASTSTLFLIGIWKWLIQMVMDVWVAFWNFIEKVRGWASDFIKTMKNTIGAVVQAWKDIDWIQIGKNAMQGIINGISSMAGALWSVAYNIGQTAIRAIKAALGIHSPSIEFLKVGIETTTGLAKGIKAGTDTAVKSSLKYVADTISTGTPLQAKLDEIAARLTAKVHERAKATVAVAVNPVVSKATSPVPSTSSTASSAGGTLGGGPYGGGSQDNSTNNYNLNITTNACREPIIADFRMLAGFS